MGSASNSPLLPPPSSQDFLTKLVCNLLDEGNALFRDGDWEQAVKEFSEGLNVSCYAAAEELQISEVLLESLYINRAATYHSMVRYIWSRMFLRWRIIPQYTISVSVRAPQTDSCEDVDSCFGK